MVKIYDNDSLIKTAYLRPVWKGNDGTWICNCDNYACNWNVRRISGNILGNYTWIYFVLYKTSLFNRIFNKW